MKRPAFLVLVLTTGVLVLLFVWKGEAGRNEHGAPSNRSSPDAVQGAWPEGEEEVVGFVSPPDRRQVLASDDPGAVDRAELEVQVVSALHRGPLAGVTVELSQAGLPTGPDARITDSEGRARYEPFSGRALELEITETQAHGWIELDLDPLEPGEHEAVQLELATPGDRPWFGRVTFRGQPVAGARVRLLQVGEDDVPRAVQETESGSTGLARFAVDSWRAYDARADLSGAGVAIAELVDGHQTPATAQELTLWPVASLHCSVVDGTAAPRGGIEVRASARALDLFQPGTQSCYSDRVSASAVTNAAGEALLENVPAEVPLDFELLRGETLVLMEERAQVLAAGERGECRFVLGASGRVAGSVLGHNGKMAADVRVELTKNDRDTREARLFRPNREPACVTRTDATGCFAFEEIAYGVWYVGSPVDDTDEQTYMLERRVVLDASCPEALVSLRVESGLLIRGTVSGGSGAPLAAVPVQAWNDAVGGVRSVSAGDGAIVLGPLPAGLYEVWVQSPAGFLDVPPFQAAAGVRDLVVHLEPGQRLTGFVIDVGSGERVEQTIVHAFAPSSDRPYAFRGYCHSPDGRFEFSQLPPGEIALRATAPDGRIGVLRGINVATPGGSEEVELRLHVGIPVRVRYSGPARDELAILATMDGIPIAYVAIEPEAVTTFSSPPGRLILLAEGKGMAPISTGLDLTVGDRPDVVLRADE